MKDNQIITAKASFVHTSPRKLRLVAKAVSALTPEKAVWYLKMINKRAARPLLLVMQQAIANAKNNFAANPGLLMIESLQVMEGPRGAKRTDKSHGARFDRGVKRRRMAHILVKLSVREK
jgi:large subunit ribosomal protein L22